MARAIALAALLALAALAAPLAAAEADAVRGALWGGAGCRPTAACLQRGHAVARRERWAGGHPGKQICADLTSMAAACMR